MSYNHFPPPPDEPLPVPVVPRELKVKRTVPTPRKAPTVRSGKGSIFGRATIPSVYWANDEPTPVNNSVYTFYREGTPPPDEKGAAAAAAHARNRGLGLYDDERRGRAGRRRCCGLRMGLFWALVALIIVVVLGVGVGVGVGISMGRRANQTDGGAARTSSAIPTPTSSRSSDASHTVPATATTPSSSAQTPISDSVSPTSPPASRTSSASTASATATSGATAVCPEANNTIYSPEGSDKRFLRVCGIDYTGEAEAIDMYNVLAGSMGECIEVCSKAAQCTGVAWGNTTSAGGAAEHRCWLKRDMKQSHETADRNWNFAILV